MLSCPRLLLPFGYDGSLCRRPGSTLGRIPRMTLPSNRSRAEGPRLRLFCLIGLLWLYLFSLCSVLKGFPSTIMVLGIPVISTRVHAKTSALVLRRFRNLSLKCFGSCFLMVTICFRYLLLTIIFSSTSVKLRTLSVFVGDVSLILFTPSLIFSDSCVENTVAIP
ncbi:hypothetical protein Tco_1572967 [Tanacetum coccineum]